MSSYKSAAAERTSNALLICILVGVVVFAGWLASTSKYGFFGGIVLFICGLVGGAIPGALIFAGLDHVLGGSGQGAKPTPRSSSSPTSGTAAAKRIRLITVEGVEAVDRLGGASVTG